MVPVPEARAQVDFPGAGPAEVPVRPAVQRDPDGFRQLRIRLFRYLVGREESIERGHMAVNDLGFVEILEPLLDLPVPADAVRRQALTRRLCLSPEPWIHSKHLRGRSHMIEQVAQQLVIQGWAETDLRASAGRGEERVLRRNRGRRY